MAAVPRLTLNQALKDLHPATEIDTVNDKYTNNILKTFVETGAREIELNRARCTRVPVGPDYRQYLLRMGRGLELGSDGMLIFRAYIDVGYLPSGRQISRSCRWPDMPVGATLGSHSTTDYAYSYGAYRRCSMSSLPSGSAKLLRMARFPRGLPARAR